MNRWGLALIAFTFCFVMAVMALRLPPAGPEVVQKPKSPRTAPPRPPATSGDDAPAPIAVPIPPPLATPAVPAIIENPAAPEPRASSIATVLAPKRPDPTVPNFGRLVVDLSRPVEETKRVLGLYEDALRRIREGAPNETRPDGSGFDTVVCAAELTNLAQIDPKARRTILDYTDTLAKWEDLAPLAGTLGRLPLAPEEVSRLTGNFWVDPPARQRFTLTVLAGVTTPEALDLQQTALLQQASPDVQMTALDNLSRTMEKTTLDPDRCSGIMNSLQSLAASPLSQSAVRCRAVKAWAPRAQGEARREFLRSLADADPSSEVRDLARSMVGE